MYGLEKTIPVMVCPECRLDGINNRSECPSCKWDELESTGREVKAWSWSVAMYETDRAYGGPEEGGWYYTCGDIIKATARTFDTIDAARCYAEFLRAKAERDKRWYSFPEGLTVKVYTDQEPPAGFPERKPYYC